ncbi:hypothetical protein [Marinobacterium sp. BA1]|uniref:hypothetical protein n=1 Tax=Marinobacterium sp. BA1 TaxID=3138931 RepID=UPI0032E55048
MMNILHLQAISHELPAFVQALEARGIASRSVRDLCADDLRASQVLLIEAHIDQKALLGMKDGLMDCLNAGGTIVFNGHLVYPLIDGLEPFQVAAGRGRDDLVVERVHTHPVFDGVDCQDLSFRRGVAGFYARGANPPPVDAQVLHRLKQDGSPIDWVWQRPEGGQVFMHSGNTMWMYLNDKSSPARIAPQLLDWVCASASELTEEAH